MITRLKENWKYYGPVVLLSSETTADICSYDLNTYSGEELIRSETNGPYMERAGVKLVLIKHTSNGSTQWVEESDFRAAVVTDFDYS